MRVVFKEFINLHFAYITLHLKEDLARVVNPAVCQLVGFRADELQNCVNVRRRIYFVLLACVQFAHLLCIHATLNQCSLSTKNMKKESDKYRRSSHSVTLLNYHFVWCPKRRKPVLVGDIKHRLQEIIFELCTENNWQLIALEIMSDHVHLFIEAEPTFAPSVIIKRIKGRASHHLRKEFPELLKLPTLWTPSYFCSTTGSASSETVRKYIESQRNK